MNTWDVRFMDGDNEIARRPVTTHIPPEGREILIEDTLGLGHGGKFRVDSVREVYGPSGAHTSTALALSGGTFEVYPRTAYVNLQRLT